MGAASASVNDGEWRRGEGRGAVAGPGGGRGALGRCVWGGFWLGAAVLCSGPPAESGGEGWALTFFGCSPGEEGGSPQPP